MTSQRTLLELNPVFLLLLSNPQFSLSSPLPVQMKYIPTGPLYNSTSIHYAIFYEEL